jgi:hypothetical protein
MKPKLAFAWFLVSLALTALLVVNWRNAAQQKHRLEALQLQFEKLDLQEKTAKARVAELEKELSQTRGELRAAEIDSSNSRLAYQALASMTNAPRVSPQSGLASAQGQQQQPGGGMGSFLSNMMKDPEMRKMMEQQQRTGLELVYGSLFKQLQLTPDQDKDFREALLAMQMTNITQGAAMFDRSVTNRAEMTQQLAENRKQMEDRLKGILGEEKYGQFQDYTQTMGERMMLDQFSRTSQISPEQSEQLLTIMREEKKNMQVNLGNQAFDPNRDWQQAFESNDVAEKLLQQQELVNERVLERAHQVLAPEQIDQFRSFVTNQVSLQRAGMKMARQMFQGSGAAPPSPPRQE